MVEERPRKKDLTATSAKLLSLFKLTMGIYPLECRKRKIRFLWGFKMQTTGVASDLVLFSSLGIQPFASASISHCEQPISFFSSVFVST